MDTCIRCGATDTDLIREFFRRLPPSEYGVSLRCGWVCVDIEACAERVARQSITQPALVLT